MSYLEEYKNINNAEIVRQQILKEKCQNITDIPDNIITEETMALFIKDRVLDIEEKEKISVLNTTTIQSKAVRPNINDTIVEVLKYLKKEFEFKENKALSLKEYAEKLSFPLVFVSIQPFTDSQLIQIYATILGYFGENILKENIVKILNNVKIIGAENKVENIPDSIKLHISLFVGGLFAKYPVLETKIKNENININEDINHFKENDINYLLLNLDNLTKAQTQLSYQVLKTQLK